MAKRKSKRKFKTAIAILSLLILVGSITYFTVLRLKPTQELQQPKQNGLELYSSELNIYRQYGVHREDYGSIPGMWVWDPRIKNYSFVPETSMTEVFKKLPKLPENFHIIQYQQLEQGIVDYCGLAPEYYEQPEFIDIHWMRLNSVIYKEPDPTHVRDTGKGVFKQYNRIDLRPKDDPRGYSSGTVCVFVWPGFGIWKHVGAKIYVYPLSQGNIANPHTQNCEHYSVTDTDPFNKGISVKPVPDNVLFGPNYPYFETGTQGGFGWIKKVALEIKVDKDTPPGEYGIGIDLVPPPEYVSANYSAEVLEKRGVYAVPRGIGPFNYGNAPCGSDMPPAEIRLVVH